ncbi:MAG TPA: hypothetical protein VN317_07865 [Candidatus Methanoperedens sp.]|nr:hypothetical protein [Candidatus Methanoperedens sp.]
MARRGHRSGNEALKPRNSLLSTVVWLLWASAILFVPAPAGAGQITISWDPGPEVTTVGYKLHNAPAGQPFGTPVDVGNLASVTLTGLDEGAAYHAAVTAYDELGQESVLSAEVVYNARQDDPANADTDGDGLTDALEAAGCTSPTDADTDDDGLAEGSEDANKDGVRDAAETNPCAADTDGDGLQDGTELGLALAGTDTDLAVFRPDLDPATATDPLGADTDGDGLLDGREDLNANGRVDAGETDPRVSDNPLLFADTFADGSKTGDPNWRRILGSWSVVGSAKRYASTKAPVSLALIADPRLRDFRSGRIESWVSLTQTYATAPEARIVFHYQDATHFRYVRLSTAGLSIGQVGSDPIERAGVKATLTRRFKLNAGYKLRIDIANGTDMKVYLNGGATPALGYRFVVNSAGRVGYRTEGAKSLFDNVAVWTEAVLQ